MVVLVVISWDGKSIEKIIFKRVKVGLKFICVKKCIVGGEGKGECCGVVEYILVNCEFVLLVVDFIISIVDINMVVEF